MKSMIDVDYSHLKDWQGEVETLGEWQSQLYTRESMGEIKEKSKIEIQPGGGAVLPTAAKEELTLVDLTHCDNKMVTKVINNQLVVIVKSV